MGHTRMTTITTTIENEHVDDGKKDMNDDDTYNDGQRNENTWRTCSIVSQSAGLAHQMLMLGWPGLHKVLGMAITLLFCYDQSNKV